VNLVERHPIAVESSEQAPAAFGPQVDRQVISCLPAHTVRLSSLSLAGIKGPPSIIAFRAAFCLPEPPRPGWTS
jgi:hypothetical protein